MHLYGEDVPATALEIEADLFAIDRQVAKVMQMYQTSFVRVLRVQPKDRDMNHVLICFKNIDWTNDDTELPKMRNRLDYFLSLLDMTYVAYDLQLM